MLVINNQQIEVFNKAALDSFETEMVAHCNYFSPELCNVIGEEQLRIAIQRAIERAKEHGFTQRGPVRLYLEMMLLFGSNFDTDPQYPWIKEIFANNSIDSQMQSAEQLFNKIVEYQKNVNGPDDTNTVNALDQILSVSQNPPVLPKEKFISMMLKETSEIFPEKYNFVGDEALNLLFNKGVIEAQNYEMKSTQGWLLICVLKIAFGDGCTIDPLYPWIERTLKDEKITDSEKRLNRLKNKSITWLRQVIANFKNKERQ